MNKEWLTEPNVKVFSYQDIVCLIIRNPEMLHFCGYVFIPPGHSLYEKTEDGLDLSVHGGITFSSFFQNEKSAWALGFDCAHYQDHVPAMPAFPGPSVQGETYKNIDFVENELRELVDQIIDKHTTSEMKTDLASTIDSRLAKALLVDWNKE